jgi:hypothetical protein
MKITQIKFFAVRAYFLDLVIKLTVKLREAASFFDESVNSQPRKKLPSPFME